MVINNLKFKIQNSKLILLEHLGSGMPRILSFYSKENFNFTDNFLRVSFPMTKDKLNSGINEGVNSLYYFIKENPLKRVSYMEKELSIPAKTLERWIKELKKENKIEFIGAPKTGGYKIKK